jgi:hypothetical protein
MIDKNLKFIEKAKLIHGDKFDYSLVEYTESKFKVKIICPIHGEFEQRASGHLSGYGCSKCSQDKQKISIDDFIGKSKSIHGDKFNYSNVEYINYDTKVKIICPIHGEFEQTPSNHLKGRDCELCSFIKRKTKVLKFIEKAKLVHNDKYDYSLVEYLGFGEKVKMICSNHGNFEQTPQNHLKGQGCPFCKESKGENKIRELLDKFSIKFIPQHKFDECKNKNVLPFDFYLPEYNTCIEFNGIQHYKPIDYFGGEKRFKEQQKTDAIKKDYCEKNKIKLIVIKYNENVNKITTILKLKMNEQN